MATGTASRSTLHVDKTGSPFSLRLCCGADVARLECLYEGFEPKGRAQGLPPGGLQQRTRWLEMLAKGAINLVAHAAERVVGHAALLEIEPGGRCEYMIFVHQDDRNRGIGTALTRSACEVARQAGYRTLWLSVAANNMPAIRVYEKVGFRMIGPPETEREMCLELRGPQADEDPPFPVCAAAPD
ncbi:MAG: GNAT family N-acetyltransferase [Deltaproteobacteria bacterium]|nr:GNAT family N-acetyltransferase [Deltaproteobacteria bacterium]